MHRHDASSEGLTEAIVRYAVDRVREDPPLDGPCSPAELRERAGVTITDEGIGWQEALRIYEEVLAPACISVDHPRFLSFVPAAPTDASVLFDLVVSASSVCATSWLEASGVIHAENEALRWIADLVGWPAGAGGTFVSGGTAGNLSALVAARWAWRRRVGAAAERTRGLIVASAGSHSSVDQAARVMDADVVVAPMTPEGRMVASAVEDSLRGLDPVDQERAFAVVASAGTTNAGIVDDMSGIADVAARRELWLHVDGAYGGAALAAPSVRDRFAGIERCDSFIVDPHKWLYAPFDACALLYRDPSIARAAHAQQAGYLDVIRGDDPTAQPWNPSDYAHHLSRRARGLPLWFSLATHGTEAYTAAIETTLRVAREAARLVDEAGHTELVTEPELSVVLFRRLGWSRPDYQAWSDEQLAAGVAFVTPTTWDGETLLRLCIVNPETTREDIAAIVEALADPP